MQERLTEWIDEEMSKSMNTMGATALLPLDFFSLVKVMGHFLLRGPLMMMIKPVSLYIDEFSFVLWPHLPSASWTAIRVLNYLSAPLFLPLCTKVWGWWWQQKRYFRSSVKWPRRSLYLADGVSYKFSSVLLGCFPRQMTHWTFWQPSLIESAPSYLTTVLEIL